MLVLWLIVCGLFLLGIRKRDQEDAYLCKSETTTINGGFVLFVFLSHAWGCLVPLNAPPSGIVDGWTFRLFVGFFGQLRVVPFLFFSGYGVMESIKAQGDAYVRRIPVRRIVGTFVNFDIAVLLFIVLGVCLSGEFDAVKAVHALLGWNSYGNSHWYVFCVIFCYLMTWAAFRFLKGCKGLLALCLLMLVYSCVMQVNDRIGWWNTAWAYCYGVAFSIYKDSWTGWLRRWRRFLFVGSLIGIAGLFVMNALTKDAWLCGFVHNIRSACFMMFILVVLLNYTVTSPILHWFGANLFPLYIYQRIPMILLCFLGGSWFADRPLAFSVLSFAILLPIVVSYKYWRVEIK